MAELEDSKEMEETITGLQRLIDEHAGRRSQIRVLEAGCGSVSHVHLPDNCTIDGIDLSATQLARNESLSRKIQGDLETHALPNGEYDLVVSWDVLEHLPRPNMALKNIFSAVRPGGLVVLAMPNVNSFEAKLTKWTPHFLHIWVLRYIFRSKRAGKEDHGPFKTYLKRETAIDRIEELAAGEGFETVMSKTYSRGRAQMLKRRAPLLHLAYAAAAVSVATVTRGRVDSELSSCVLVLRKA